MEAKVKQSAVIMSKKRTHLESYVDYDERFHETVHFNNSFYLMLFHACIHGDHKSFLAKRAQFRGAGTLPILGFCSKDTPGLQASYRVPCRKAKEQPHTID